MNNAKCVWILSNGESISIGDKIQVNNGREVYEACVTDVAETYICGKTSIGEEFDAYFKDLKDIRVISSQ